MNLDVQFLTMISMVLGGFYLGMALDTFRRFSPYWKNHRFLVYLLEIIFWLTQAFILFYILYRVNYGSLRVYIFVAVGLGFSMYKALVATAYQRLLEIIIRIIVSSYRFLTNVFYYLIIMPIKWIVTTILSIVIMVVRLLIKILQLALKIIWTPIKWLLLGIYRLLPRKFRKLVHKMAGFYSIMKNTLIRWTRLVVKRRK